jgi:hypothetical protein
MISELKKQNRLPQAGLGSKNRLIDTLYNKKNARATFFLPLGGCSAKK